MSLKTQKTEITSKEEGKLVEDPKVEKKETPTEPLPEEDIEGNPIDNPETPADESQDEEAGEDKFLDEFDDDDDSEATLEADKALKEKVSEGKIPGLKPQDASYIQSSMVPHPLSGKPVYATAEAAMIAETYKEK